MAKSNKKLGIAVGEGDIPILLKAGVPRNMIVPANQFQSIFTVADKGDTIYVVSIRTFTMYGASEVETIVNFVEKYQLNFKCIAEHYLNSSIDKLLSDAAHKTLYAISNREERFIAKVNDFLQRKFISQDAANYLINQYRIDSVCTISDVFNSQGVIKK